MAPLLWCQPGSQTTGQHKLTDGQARGSQAQYSYKFNEHPDSREFVALARSSLCTHWLTGLDTLMEQVGGWQSDLTYERSSSFRAKITVNKHFLAWRTDFFWCLKLRQQIAESKKKNLFSRTSDKKPLVLFYLETESLFVSVLQRWLN